MNTRRASIAAMAVVLMATAACADGGYGLNPRPYGDGRPEIRPQASGPRQDPDARWRERYSKTYSYSDDIYYQECREAPDPAGVLAGALIGGLLGNAIAKGGGRTGGTIAGVVVGGALGAAGVCQRRHP